MSTVLWRRTLDAVTGELLFEGPVQPELEEDESHHFKEPLNTVTELWHSGKSAALTTSFLGYDDSLEEVSEGWDGSFENPFTGKNIFYKIYVTDLAKGVGDFNSSLSDSSTDEEDMTSGGPKFSKGMTLTRQEQKAIEKELQCSDIMKQSPDYIEAFVDAARKEATSFQTWKSLRPIPPAEAKRILADPKLRRRAMSSRAVYRDKPKGVAPLRAKCRVVIRGNQDPDLRSITRNAPTPSRLSEPSTFQVLMEKLSRPRPFGSSGPGTSPQRSFRASRTWKNVRARFSRGRRLTRSSRELARVPCMRSLATCMDWQMPHIRGQLRSNAAWLLWDFACTRLIA